MPPMSCMPLQRDALGALADATSLAIDARHSAAPPATSISAARTIRLRAASSATAPSTSQCCGAWNEPIGLPNTSRSRA